MTTATKSKNVRLTKAETVALWHALNNMEFMVRSMRDMEGITPEQIALEQDRLATGKRALRKVNKLREQGY